MPPRIDGAPCAGPPITPWVRMRVQGLATQPTYGKGIAFRAVAEPTGDAGLGTEDRRNEGSVSLVARDGRPSLFWFPSATLSVFDALSNRVPCDVGGAMSRTKPETPPGGSAPHPTPHPEPSPQPATPEPDPIIFSIRGTREWREWLSQFAAHQRVTPTVLIDQVLAEAARRAGFAAPPPRHRASDGRHARGESGPPGRHQDRASADHDS
jgi:hypothetical protein